MANNKGNQYPLWYISNERQIMAVDHNGESHPKSEVNFAFDIGISEDGTVWIISTTPDPDGGGGRIFWSNGDSIWNEIATSSPGGMRISGAEASNCIYTTANRQVYTLNTAGSASSSFKDVPISLISYGGDYLWGVLPEEVGGIAVLRYLKVTDPAQTWHTFPGNILPSSISASHNGKCGAVVDNNPMFFSPDGKTSGSAGQGADGKTLQISFTNNSFIITMDANPEGNQIMEWRIRNQGTFVATPFRGIRIESSYYAAS